MFTSVNSVKFTYSFKHLVFLQLQRLQPSPSMVLEVFFLKNNVQFSDQLNSHKIEIEYHTTRKKLYLFFLGLTWLYSSLLSTSSEFNFLLSCGVVSYSIGFNKFEGSVVWGDSQRAELAAIEDLVLYLTSSAINAIFSTTFDEIGQLFIFSNEWKFMTDADFIPCTPI